AENGNYYWRITPFVMPCFTMIPPRGDHPIHGHFWIPIDDETCWAWSYDFHPVRALAKREVDAMRDGAGVHCKYIPGTYRPHGNNQALKDGSVKPKTFEFDFEEVDPLIAAFRRMVRGLEFDICEMAITTYVCAKAHGKRMTAVPVPIVRAFHHGAILVNSKAGIAKPNDLEGKRVGVNRGYTVTT